MSKKVLINMAKEFVNTGFHEKSLKTNANHFIEYKFNKSVNFSKITELHFDVFRRNKNLLHKIKAMTIIELIILASDILDDIQDQDAKDVPWSTIDDAINLNIVVGLLIICMKESDGIAGEEETKWIQGKIYELILQSISGQQIDLINKLNNEKDYIQMCYKKSGSLIRLACSLGTGKVDDELNRSIKKYSNYLGVIFQLRNDVLDLKSGFIKSDILLKKRTLPIIYYLNTKDELYKPIQDYYLKGSTTFEPKRIHQKLLSGNALLYCEIVEEIYIHKLKECVNNLKIDLFSKKFLFTSIDKFLTF